MPRQEGIKLIAQNKMARHEYFIEETYECGLALVGSEVKSLRSGRVNLKESFCVIRKDEIFTEGMHISPYEHGSFSNPDPMRPKKLLLHKAEIRKLSSLVARQGYALIPLSVYLKNGRMKMELGLCKGKHIYDKRSDAAKTDARREIERALKNKSRI